MDMTGEYHIAAPRQKVWEALNDTEILRQSITGCEKVEKLSATEMTATVRAKVGPVSARFTGKVTLSDLDPPNGYRISGEGTGGPAGFAKGGATVKLVDDNGGTKLTYVVEASIGGKLAQIGSRLIDATARQMAEQFFSKFTQIVSAASAATEAPPVGAAPEPSAASLEPSPAPSLAPVPAPPAPPPLAPAPKPSTTPPPAASGRMPPMLWVTILAAVVVALLYYFTKG